MSYRYSQPSAAALGGEGGAWLEEEEEEPEHMYWRDHVNDNVNDDDDDCNAESVAPAKQSASEALLQMAAYHHQPYMVGDLDVAQIHDSWKGHKGAKAPDFSNKRKSPWWICYHIVQVPGQEQQLAACNLCGKTLSMSAASTMKRHIVTCNFNVYTAIRLDHTPGDVPLSTLTPAQKRVLEAARVEKQRQRMAMSADGNTESTPPPLFNGKRQSQQLPYAQTQQPLAKKTKQEWDHRTKKAYAMLLAKQDIPLQFVDSKEFKEFVEAIAQAAQAGQKYKFSSQTIKDTIFELATAGNAEIKEYLKGSKTTKRCRNVKNYF